jgi:hypothetical protein
LHRYGVVEMIEAAFGMAAPAVVEDEAAGAGAEAPRVGGIPPAVTADTAATTEAPATAEETISGASTPGELRERHAVRPPVRHAYGCPPPAAEVIRQRAAAAAAAELVDPYQPMVATESGVQLFQHEHLSHVSFNIFSKLPVLPLRHMGDLHRTVNQRIVLLALQSRIQSRYAELDHEHYKRCELDHSDSAREGCTVSTVTVGGLITGLTLVHSLSDCISPQLSFFISDVCCFTTRTFWLPDAATTEVTTLIAASQTNKREHGVRPWSTVTCEPLHWKYALQVAVEEARRLQQCGLMAGELARFKSAMMRDSEQLAQQAGFVPSLENLDFVMEHDALGHVVGLYKLNAVDP